MSSASGLASPVAFAVGFSAPALALTPASSSGASTPLTGDDEDDVVLKRELDALDAPFSVNSSSAAAGSPFLFSALPMCEPAPLDLNRHRPAVVGDDGEPLFAAYTEDSPPFPPAWDYYMPPAAMATAAPRYPSTPTDGAAAGRGIVRRASTDASSAQAGVKRPFDAMSSASTSGAATPASSPTAVVASSMIAMRSAEAASSLNSSTNTINISTARTGAARVKKEDATGASGATTPTTAKKTKVSRERQLKINAASRRCRKKQKLELQFLRAHVVELQAALKDQVNHLRSSVTQQQRAARLSQFVEDSVRKVDEMSSGGRSATTPATTSSSPGTPGNSAFSLDKFEVHSGGEESSSSDVNQIETDDASSVMHAIDPATGYSLSEERKRALLNVAAFIRVNMSLESGSFSPEVISCLPIEMDGWQLRLAITEKNYTIHNAKFFPCGFTDMYDFCWETNVAQKISIKHGRKHYVVVTPLAPDVAHVYSKTTGKWSLNVHGVPNVSYNSLVCRRLDEDAQRAIICQQSVLEERDFQDEDTIPWLFKRWVVFRPRVVDGVAGTYVEAYRTASYATGRLIYKGHNTYDSFCEHLIRRYAESNSLLERMMARDPRFAHAFDPKLRAGGESATVSDRMTKDLLLF